MTSPVCVDASFVVKLVVPEPNSDQAEARWAAWLNEGAQILAPALLPFEVTSAIRKKVQRGAISEERGRQALEVFMALAENLELALPDELHLRAWELASANNRPNLYDSYYVALAEGLGCRLWSADDHLRRAMPAVAGIIASLTDQ